MGSSGVPKLQYQIKRRTLTICASNGTGLWCNLLCNIRQVIEVVDIEDIKLVWVAGYVCLGKTCDKLKRDHNPQCKYDKQM